MTVIARIFRGQPVRWYHAACGILAAVYAANAEQMCIVLLAVFGVALLYQLHTRRAERNAVILLAVFCCIIVAELLFILTCPGNQNRTLAETQTWNPAFSQLQLGQKLQLGIVDTLYILQAGWVLLYGLLCLLLLVWLGGNVKCIRFALPWPVFLLDMRAFIRLADTGNTACRL